MTTQYEVTSEDQITWESELIGNFDTLEEAMAAVPDVEWQKQQYPMGNQQWEADEGDIVYFIEKYVEAQD